MEAGTPAPTSGRRAQAARNDELILAAAREVFIEDAAAPIAAVAERAGVGISALYRRYGSKEDLLRRICGDGLRAYVEAAEAAVADDDVDPWEAFAEFMRRVVDAGSTELTIHLAGTFTPTEELYADAQRAQTLNQEIFRRLTAEGAIRDDVVVDDLAFVLEQVASVKVRDPDRTVQLRRRYLALLLDALRVRPDHILPGPAPTWQELGERWET